MTRLRGLRYPLDFKELLRKYYKIIGTSRTQRVKELKRKRTLVGRWKAPRNGTRLVCLPVEQHADAAGR